MLKRIVSFSLLALVLICLALASPYPILYLGDGAYAAAAYPDAEQRYDLASRIALLPDARTQAIWGRAQARLKQDAYESAIADYTLVLAASPSMADAYSQRGYAHLQLKHYPDAVDDLTAYLTASPGQPDALAERGYAHLQLKDYQQAIDDLTAYLSVSPGQPDALAQRGQAELQLDQLDAAIADLQAAVDLTTSHMDDDRASLAEAYFRRAKRSAAAGDYKRVVSDLSLALQADATRAEMHALRAYANLQLEQYAGAVADASDAISLNPDALDAFAYRAAAFAAQAQWQRAADDATRALSGSSLAARERALACYARALSGAALGRYQSAVADAGDALALATLDRPRATTLYVVRAGARLELEAYQDAVSDYGAALDLEPKNDLAGTIYAGRGWAYLMLEEFPEAVRDFSSALQISPSDPWLYQNRGLAYAVNGQYQLALIDYNRALELNPRLAVVYSNRGVVYSTQQQYEKAIADFQKAIDLSDDADQRNRDRSYILLAQAAIHGQRAEQAAKELEQLTSAGSGRDADQVRQFQQNFAAIRQRLQTIQAEVGLMADQYAEIEGLDLPDWYRAYAAKLHQSLDSERAGFVFVEKAWAKTNALLDVLPQLAAQLDKASASDNLGSGVMDRYNQLLDRGDYAGARALTASMRAELQSYRDYFARAQRESGLGFLSDAVQFFGRQMDYVNRLDEITAAVETQDRARFDRALAQIDAIGADIYRLARRMAGWDTELKRWFQQNIQPLVDAADQKFEESQRLGKEAAAIFEQAPKRLIIKQPRHNFPPLIRA